MIDEINRRYIAWINRAEAWLNAVNLNSTDPQFDHYDWYAAFTIGLTPLDAVRAAREMAEAHLVEMSE